MLSVSLIVHYQSLTKPITTYPLITMSGALEKVDAIFVPRSKKTPYDISPDRKPDPSSSILPKGAQIRGAESLPLPCDILFEKDVTVTLRDGVKIYVDIFRPPHPKAGIVPAIISAGPYGKEGRRFFHDFTDHAPWRFAIPQKMVSGLEKFEGLDPAYWCFHGYAIVHPGKQQTLLVSGSHADDRLQIHEVLAFPRVICRWLASKRGETITTSLSGLLSSHGTTSGKNAVKTFDFPPYTDDVLNSVSMAGNSWLTQTQWFTGAERPPHLTCLAPSEGWNDFYNDTANRGGIPDTGFWDWLISQGTHGRGMVEDVKMMSTKYNYANSYWVSHKAKLDNIEIPLLVTASYTSKLHTGGTFRGWLETKSREKWLRVHASNEWPGKPIIPCLQLLKPANICHRLVQAREHRRVESILRLLPQRRE